MEIMARGKAGMNRFKTVVLMLCVLLAGCSGTSQLAMLSPSAPSSLKASPSATQDPTTAPTPAPTPTPKPVEINLMAVGDIMFQYFEIQSAYDKVSKSYDFNYSFKYVRDILGSADLAMGNLETTLGGPPYTRRKSLIFSAPDEAADAIKAAGFDVLSTSNNHENNKGSAGILRTMQVLGDKGIVYAGTRKSVEAKPYVIEDIKGIKVGVTAYTWCARLKNGGYKLDSQAVAKDTGDLVNVFSNATIDKDLADMGNVARRMREDGAEIIVFYIHWGAEYRRSPDKNQIKIARGLAGAGVDIVLGSHPHWLQTVDVLPNGITGGKTIVAYSLGNFISCQRDEYDGEGYNFKYSEDNMILNLKIVKQPGAAASVSQVEYLPTWTFMYLAKGKRSFTVVPLEKAIASPEAYGMNTNRDLRSAQKSFDNTQKLLAGAVANGVLSPMKLP
jgi:poly-gamma-glutamate capsule biosynthesis protein CapA/YwtB (metallophosphatase superfamily)